MASIEKALQIAARAHEGQKDKDGQPVHPAPASGHERRGRRTSEDRGSPP